MSQKFKLSGIVYRHGSEIRMYNASLRAYKKNLKDAKEWTNKDGRFEFSGLEPGKWKIEILHNKSQPRTIDVELTQDTSEFQIDLYPLADDVDNKAGQIFLYGLFATLATVIFIYIYLHTSLPQAKGPLSGILVEMIFKTQAYVNDIETLNTKLVATIPNINKALNNGDELRRTYVHPLQKAIKGGKKDETLKLLDSLKSAAPNLEPLIMQAKEEATKLKQLNEDAELKAMIVRIDTTLKKIIKANNKLMPADKELIIEYIKSIQGSMRTNNSEAVMSQLKELQRNIEFPPIRGFITWTRIPWRFLEVLFWALGGVLVSKIVESGYYLRFRRFYREGIKMHLSHIATVPLMVLVAMLLLSLMSFEFKLSESGTPVQFDLSDPNILAAISFILAGRPWAVWQFIRSAGEKITKQGEND